MKSAFLTLILIGLLFLLDEDSAYFLISVFFAAIGIFLYGIPVSLFSDFITKKMDANRFIVAAIIHVSFGFLTTFIIGFFGIIAIVSSIIFFLIDEAHKISFKQHKLSKKTIFINGMSIIILFSLSFFGWKYFMHPDRQEKTHEYYLIPDGYVGKVTVVHDIPHAPPPKKVGEYNLIEINEKGYGITQLPISEGLIENKYFYIDSQGNKQEIEQSCIQSAGISSIAGEGYEYDSTYYTVSEKRCGEYGGFNYVENELTLEEILLEENLAEIVNHQIVIKPNKSF